MLEEIEEVEEPKEDDEPEELFQQFLLTAVIPEESHGKCLQFPVPKDTAAAEETIASTLHQDQ